MSKFSFESLKDASIFRKFYFINMLLTYVVFFNYISYALAVLMVPWAIFIIIDKVKTNQITKIKNYKVLILFLISATITSLFQLKMSKPLNTGFDFVMIIHFCMCFFIFYGLHTEKKAKIEKELLDIMHLTISIATLLTFFSLLFIIFKSKICFSVKIFGFKPIYYCIGMHSALGVERLAGLYVNPNMIAFCSVVAIVFSYILFLNNKFFPNLNRHFQISFFISIIVLNLAAIFLSDSVASFIFILVYALLVLFYRLVLKNRKVSVRLLLRNCLIFLAIGLFSLVILTLVRGNFQNIVSNVVNSIYATFSTDDVNSGEAAEITIGRGKNYDIKDGSGRRHLLKQALHILAKNPLLGIGIGNIEEYGKLYFKNGVDFTNFHNGYVSVAVSYGFVGFTFFMIFLLKTFINFIKALKKSAQENDKIFPNLAACVAAYCVYSLFEKTMLSEVNFMGVFFWIILGYSTVYASNLLKSQYKS